MLMSRCVAVVGATGLVGRTMLAVLEERQLPVDELRLFASARSAGRTLPFRGAPVPVRSLDERSFEGVDLVLFAAGNPVSQQWAPVAVRSGARVVDNSSAFRYHDEVPLVVPEINGRLLDPLPSLVANPNCSTIAIVMALAPLATVVPLERVWVATYQSVSGGGQSALDQLESGVRAGLDGPPPLREGGQPPFAFNVVPQIAVFEDNGYTREEMKIVWESRKILNLPELAVSATAVRVPVRVGHAAAVHATFARPITPDEARTLWRIFPGLEIVDEPGRGRYPTPLQAAGRDAVLVGRVRRDLSDPKSLEFFVASDNLRKGAALNAVQIAEALLDREAATRR
jgi:aspartate-semialdehyde dehydrogenase